MNKDLTMYETVAADVKMIKDMAEKLAYGELNGVGKFSALEAISNCAERLGNDVTYFKEMCNQKMRMLQEDERAKEARENTFNAMDDMISDLQMTNDQLLEENLRLREELKMREIDVIHSQLQAFINKEV